MNLGPALASLALLSGSLARADELYGLACVEGYLALIHVDTEHRHARVVGPTGAGVNQWTGLAFDAAGTLWASDTEKLYTVSLVNGRATRVGFLGTSAILSLAVDPFDDTLYAVKKKPNQNCRLSTIDPVGLTVTSYGSPGPLCAGSLSFDPWGRLFGLDAIGEQLLLFDKATGTSSVVRAGGLAAFPGLGGLAFGRSGTLWSVELGTGYTPLRLVRIDPVTGRAEEVANLAITGAVFACQNQPLYGLASYVPGHPRDRRAKRPPVFRELSR